MKSYMNLSCNDALKIIHHQAATKIQAKIRKFFYKIYGPEWIIEIKRKNSLVYKYDYYCYRKNICDPLHDYIDDLDYQ